MNKQFQVLRSSAGSGKTFSLVKEYLKIILENPPDFRNILAITFTNKAANEMKVRVMSSLRGFTDPGSIPEGTSMHHMLERLIEETKLDAASIATNAKEAERLILHHYGETEGEIKRMRGTREDRPAVSEADALGD